jgi:hypothetical protein
MFYYALLTKQIRDLKRTGPYSLWYTEDSRPDPWGRAYDAAEYGINNYVKVIAAGDRLIDRYGNKLVNIPGPPPYISNTILREIKKRARKRKWWFLGILMSLIFLIRKRKKKQQDGWL